MSAQDRFHKVVRVALEKEGWIITADPLSLKFGDSQIYIDLGAEKILAAEKGEEKIAVEIKTFANDSVMFAFHVAIGQFINYQVVLENLQPYRSLYLAVPQEIYETFFESLLAKTVIQKHQIRLIIYDLENEVIVEWLT